MYYSCGNIDGKALELNANEVNILELIGKCSRGENAKGWYGSMQALADALPFVISDETVRRAINKLFNLGLIERRETAWYVKPQNVATEPQNVVNEPQNVANIPQIVQNPAPPVTPLYNNEMKEKDHATCVPTHDTRNSRPIPSVFFSDLENAYREKGGRWTYDQQLAASDLWHNSTSYAKKRALVYAVKAGSFFKPRIDWLVSDFPEPAPLWLRGDEGGDIVQVRYNGAYKLCTRATMELFGLEWVRDW